VRFLVVLIALAGACEHKPAPKRNPPVQAPPTAAEPAAQVPVPPTPPPPVPADAGVAVAIADAVAAPPDAMVVSDRCVELGSHVAEVLIQEATDPSQKAAYTQDRARIVRRTAEGCTRDAWTEKTIACFMAGKTSAAMQACRKQEPVAPRPPPPPGLPPG